MALAADPEITSRTVDVDEMLVRPGTYFNPQTEIVVIVDDSTSIDQEIFNMEDYEGSDWVRVSEDVPVDEDTLDETLEEFQTHYHGGTAGSVSATALEQGDGTDDEEEDEGAPGTRAGGLQAMAGYQVAKREDAVDFMAQWPGLRRDALVHGSRRLRAGRRSRGASMPPETGGRGSYGHRHPGQEEIYFVLEGTVTFKVGDEVFEVGPQDRREDERRGALLDPQRHRRGGRAGADLDQATRTRRRSARKTSGRSSAGDVSRRGFDQALYELRSSDR